MMHGETTIQAHSRQGTDTKDWEVECLTKQQNVKYCQSPSLREGF